MFWWMHLAFCLLSAIYSVDSGCIPSEECQIQNWVDWRCSDCCKPNASPDSARRPRIICCRRGVTTLTDCLRLCNRTLDEVEMSGMCTQHCTCPNGFHFATPASTLLPSSPEPFTAVSTRTRIETSAIPLPTTSTHILSIVATQTQSSGQQSSEYSSSLPVGHLVTTPISDTVGSTHSTSPTKKCKDNSLKIGNISGDGLFASLFCIGFLAGVLTTIILPCICKSKKTRRVVDEERKTWLHNTPTSKRHVTPRGEAWLHDTPTTKRHVTPRGETWLHDTPSDQRHVSPRGETWLHDTPSDQRHVTPRRETWLYDTPSDQRHVTPRGETWLYDTPSDQRHVTPSEVNTASKQSAHIHGNTIDF